MRGGRLVVRSKIPLRLRAANLIGDGLSRLGLPLLRLNPDGLLELARRRTGLEHFGSDHFLEPFRLLLDEIARRRETTFVGRKILQIDCLRLLTNRLRIEHTISQNPEILDVPIRRPLFITGIPRSGTTLLHNLLCQDPGARFPLYWEMRHPWPLPDSATRSTDPRIDEARCHLHEVNRLVPGLSKAHHLVADGPEECYGLFEHSFTSEIFTLRLTVPEYASWLLRADMRPAYRDYRRLLQYLAWRCPGDHWALKAPMHLCYLETLLDVFPDACVVQTHRDPVEALPSLCGLKAIVHELYTETMDLGLIGQKTAERQLERTTRGLEARARLDPARFFDVHYETLLQDPLGTVRRIYDYFDYPFSEVTRARIQHWLELHPQHAHGVHRYDLERFDLDRATVQDSFARYRQKCHAVLEADQSLAAPTLPGRQPLRLKSVIT